MGTSAERSSSNTEYFTRGDKIPGLRVNGMDIIATKQAVQFARKWAVDDQKGPLLLEFDTYRYGGHSFAPFLNFLELMLMSLPIVCLIPVLPTEPVRRFNGCVAPRTQFAGSNVTLKSGASRQSRNSRYTISRVSNHYPLSNSQQLDKIAKSDVDAAVEEAKASPEPEVKDLWTDIYYKGTAPPYMRGREREEVRQFLAFRPHLADLSVGPLLLDFLSSRTSRMTCRHELLLIHSSLLIIIILGLGCKQLVWFVLTTLCSNIFRS